METVFLSLGSNVGDRLANMQQAVAVLSKILNNMNASTLYSAEPVGMVEGSPWFLNAIVQGDTDLSPEELLDSCLEIEKNLGRDRSIDSQELAPRSMDIDIIFYGDQIIETPQLVIPHPRAHMRKFVLLPMAEVAPQYVHPVLKKTIWELLGECKDASEIEKYYGKQGSL